MPRLVLRCGEPSREADRGRIATRGRAIDLRPARVGQPQQSRHLVEGLAGGIVDRLAEKLDVAHQIAHEQQRGVTAGDQQSDRRQLEGLVAGAAEHVCADVADEVVDGVERPVEREGKRFRGADADHERAREPRAVRDGDRVEVGKADARLGERGPKGGLERFEVGAGGDLGNDPAEARVLIHRRGDHVGQQRLAAHDSNAGLVAAGLDSENERFAHAGTTSWSPKTSRITSASTSSGW